MDSSLIARVATFAREHGLWSSGDRILVGLSGGPDSVALLHVLHDLSNSESITLGALHVNYGLRGAESDGDAEFCEDLCAKLSIPLRTVHVAESPTSNTQAWARAIRRHEFEEYRKRSGFQRVALGHTLDDRVEGFLLQLMRGTGPDRIGHLPACAGNLIRPLVHTRRSAIEEYLCDNRIVFRVDRTNFGESYVRNRVRHEVMPLLSNVFGVDAGLVLSAQAELLGLDAEYIEAHADELWSRVERDADEIRLATKSLESYHPAIRLRVLRRMAALLDIQCGRESSLRLLGLIGSDPGRRVELSTGVIAERGRDSLCLYRRIAPPEPITIPVPGQIELHDGSILTATEASPAPPYPDGRWRARMALPMGIKQWQVRAVQDGDRIVPFGMTGSRLVMDLLAEAGVARHLRPQRLVLTGDGEIFWILGLRIAESARASVESKNVYEFVRDAESI